MAPSAVTGSPSRLRFRRWRKGGDDSSESREDHRKRKNGEHSSSTEKSNDRSDPNNGERDCELCNISDCLDSEDSPGRPKSSVLADFLLLSLWEPGRNEHRSTRQYSYCGRSRRRDPVDTGDEASDYEATDIELNRDRPESDQSNSTMDATDDGEVSEESESPRSPPPMQRPPEPKSEESHDLPPHRRRLHAIPASSTPPEWRSLKQGSAPAMSPISSSKLLSYAEFYQESAASFQSWGPPVASADNDSEVSTPKSHTTHESSDRSHVLVSQVGMVRSTSQRSDSTPQDPQPAAAPLVSRRLFKIEQHGGAPKSAAQFPGNLVFAENADVGAKTQEAAIESADMPRLTDSLFSMETVLEEPKKAVRILTTKAMSHLDGLDKVVVEEAIIEKAGSTDGSIAEQRGGSRRERHIPVFPNRNLRRFSLPASSQSNAVPLKASDSSIPQGNCKAPSTIPKLPVSESHKASGFPTSQLTVTSSTADDSPITSKAKASESTRATSSGEPSKTDAVAVSESTSSRVETKSVAATGTTKKQQRRKSRKKKTDSVPAATIAAREPTTRCSSLEFSLGPHPVSSEGDVKTEQPQSAIDLTASESYRAALSAALLAEKERAEKKKSETRSGSEAAGLSLSTAPRFARVPRASTKKLNETISIARASIRKVSPSTTDNSSASRRHEKPDRPGGREKDSRSHSTSGPSARKGRHEKLERPASREKDSRSRSASSKKSNTKTSLKKGNSFEEKSTTDASGHGVQKASSFSSGASRTREKSKDQHENEGHDFHANMAMTSQPTAESKTAMEVTKESKNVGESPVIMSKKSAEVNPLDLLKSNFRQASLHTKGAQHQSSRAIGVAPVNPPKIASDSVRSHVDSQTSEAPVPNASKATTKTRRSRKILSFVPDVGSATTTASDSLNGENLTTSVETIASVSTSTTATTSASTQSDPAATDKSEETARTRSRRRFAARAAAGGRHEVSKLAAAVVSARRQGEDGVRSQKESLHYNPALSITMDSTFADDESTVGGVDAPPVSSPTSATRSAISLLQEKNRRSARRRHIREKPDLTMPEGADKDKSTSVNGNDSDQPETETKTAEKVCEETTSLPRRTSRQRVCSANKNTSVVTPTESEEGEDKAECRDETSTVSGSLRSGRSRGRRRALHDLVVSVDGSNTATELPGKVVIFQKVEPR